MGTAEHPSQPPLSGLLLLLLLPLLLLLLLLLSAFPLRLLVVLLPLPYFCLHQTPSSRLTPLGSPSSLYPSIFFASSATILLLLSLVLPAAMRSIHFVPLKLTMT